MKPELEKLAKTSGMSLSEYCRELLKEAVETGAIFERKMVRSLLPNPSDLDFDPVAEDEEEPEKQKPGLRAHNPSAVHLNEKPNVAEGEVDPAVKAAFEDTQRRGIAASKKRSQQ